MVLSFVCFARKLSCYSQRKNNRRHPENIGPGSPAEQNMAQFGNAKKQPSRLKRTVSLSELSSIGGESGYVSMEPGMEGGSPGVVRSSYNAPTSLYLSRTRSFSDLRTTSNHHRVQQLRESSSADERKGEREFNSQLVLHRSCDSLSQLQLDESLSRNDQMDTGGLLSNVPSFTMPGQRRSVTPTSPSHFSSRSRPVYVTRPGSPHTNSLSTMESRKRRSFHGDQDSDVDMEDQPFPSSKRILVCHSPLHISSSSPCTSPVCSSPQRKHFSALYRNSIGDFPYHGNNSSFSSRDGSLSSAPHSMSSDGEFDTEGGEPCSTPSHEHNGLPRPHPVLDPATTASSSSSSSERRKVPSRLCLKPSDESLHGIGGGGRLRRKSSSDSLCDSALGFSDTTAQSTTPLSPRDLKFLQYPSPSPHLVPVPSRSPACSSPSQPMETAWDFAGGGADGDPPPGKAFKWKRLVDGGGVTKTNALRRNMFSPLVNCSAFSKTSNSSSSGYRKTIKPSTMEEESGFDSSNPFSCGEPSLGYSQLLPGNIEGENSLGFSPTPTTN